MRIATYQAASPAGDLAAGEAAVADALAAAAGAGCDILVLPELFLPGYGAVTASRPAGWDGVHDRLARLCRSHAVALCIGLPDYDGGAVFNAAVVFGPDGTTLARYRKVQPFGARERALFTPGDRLQTFTYRGTRFGLAICYDIEFPEHARALARAGATAILVPTANMAPFVNVNLIQLPGRAMENALTIAYANYTGREGDLYYVGHSLIAGPDGYPLASKGMGPGLLVADLPTGLLENGIPFSTQLADYRPVAPPDDPPPSGS